MAGKIIFKIKTDLTIEQDWQKIEPYFITQLEHGDKTAPVTASLISVGILGQVNRLSQVHWQVEGSEETHILFREQIVRLTQQEIVKNGN